MTYNIPPCQKCSMENTYSDGLSFICPDCFHEWSMTEKLEDNDGKVIKDSNGNILSDGDSVVVIKDLKVKGSSIVVKMGTKVKSIRLVDGDHEVDCKTDFGQFMLKACFLRKA